MKDIVMDTLQTCQDYIPEVIKGVSSVAFHLQSGNEAEGIRLLSKVFEALQWLTDAVGGIQKNGFLLNLNLDIMNQQFNSLEEALKVRDYVLTADILDYEISPLLEDLLKTVVEEISNNRI